MGSPFMYEAPERSPETESLTTLDLPLTSMLADLHLSLASRAARLTNPTCEIRYKAAHDNGIVRKK